jgi:transcriptional regulator with XRE-family HTH domain
MDVFGTDALSVDIATRLRELREEKGMSLRALAARSRLSANALSMIERGKTSPSVSTLYKIADALGVTITTFFGAPAARERVVFIKAETRTRVPFQGGLWEGLGGEKFVGRVEPFMITMESGASSGPHSMVHTGHEFVFCLRGHLEYHIENQAFDLGPGDSLIFAAYLRHRWRNAGSAVANVLILLSDHAEGGRVASMHIAQEKAGPTTD